MDHIEDVYNNDVYYPFLLYCQSHNYVTMRDLGKCTFSDLGKCPGITPALLGRIKALFVAYSKKHPDLFMRRSALQTTTSAPSVPDPELAGKLEAYFAEHADTLVRVADVTKSLGAKRGEVSKILESAPWCKAVDATTFFYTPAE